MKKVVLIRSNPVSPDPPVEKVADTLLSLGFKVTVIGWDRNSNEDKTEELKLERGNAEIIRFGIPAVFGGGIKKNLIPLRKFQSKLRVWLERNAKSFDIIHAFDFDTGFIANKISKKYNKPLIYHILDFYIDSHNIPSSFLKDKIKKSEFSVINNSYATIICSEKRKEQIKGSHPKRLEIIHNTPKATEEFDSRFELKGLKDKCKIAYVGILAGSRFIREIIEFVKSDGRFEFHIGGFGSMENEIVKAAQDCERIYFYGKLPYKKTLTLENSCDIMTAIYDPKVPNHKYAAPNKFYESLMLGKPVVMAKNTGFDEIIEKNKIGCLIDFSFEGLSKGLEDLISRKENFPEISKTMKQLYKEKYSWSIMEERITNLYKGLK